MEKGGHFEPQHSEFFLFPTFAHEQTKGLKPEVAGTLQEIEKTRKNTDTLDISLLIKITETLWITDEKKLAELSPFHFWAEETIRSRFQFGQEKGIFVMLARVFRLPNSYPIPLLDKYAGCKSWVELEETISTWDALPVLSNADFDKKRGEIINILEPSLAR